MFELLVAGIIAQSNIDSTPVQPFVTPYGNAEVVMAYHKLSFAEKHPKLHKAGRKIRRTCQVLLPVVQFAGSAAQVARLFY